jgi:hypothetical protein
MRWVVRDIVSALIITLVTTMNAYASSGYTDQFNAYYGTSGAYNYQAVLGSCLTCHPSGSTRNSYANDWRNNGHNFASVELLDSDKDGFTNKAEIDARTFPGDANSRPVITNNPPVANAGPDQSVNEGVTVTLNGSNSSDPGGSIVSYQWTQTGGTAVTLSSSTLVQPTFSTPNVGPSSASLTFQLTVTDSGGLKATDTCTVNVTWVNAPPTASAGPDQTVNEGVTVTLNGSGSSDPDNGIGSYLWTQTGGAAVTLSSSTSAQPTFRAPNVGSGGTSLTFQLTVIDGGGLQATDTCIVNVTDVNLPPIANAGPDQTVNEGVTVTLNGSGSSDPDNGIGSYLWTQTGGTAVTLSGTTVVQPTFKAPNVGPAGTSLTFRLTVTDNGGLQATDTCIVSVADVNLPPIANAGPDQTVNEGVTVTLNGASSSDPDGGIASYLWTQTGGSSIPLSNPSVVNPTFQSPGLGTGGAALTFMLTVTDISGQAAQDTCIVNVTRGNLPPIANAGPDQTASEGTTVTLNGSNSSDPDNSIASYLWAQTGGLGVTLSSATTARPTFAAPNVGSGGTSLTFQLTVTDNGGLKSTDTCIVNVSWVNEPPTANAGPDQTVSEGATVMFNGSNSSDPDNGITSYLWAQTGGPAVTISGATTAKPTFTAPNVGSGGTSLTFQLTVTDNGGLKSTDTCIANVSWVNEPPTANAGPDQTVSEGATVTLNGSNSIDPDNGIATYLWAQTGGLGVTLSSATTARPIFTAPNVGSGGTSLTFQLTVTDNGGLKSTDICIINVSWLNQPPTADAGPDQTVDEGATAELDGSNSMDPDDGIASYLWSQISGPPVTLSEVNAAQPTLVAPMVDPPGAILTFMLTVTDKGGLKASSQVAIGVNDNGITKFPGDVLTTLTFAGEPFGVKENNGGSFTRLETLDPATIPASAGKPQNMLLGLIDMEIKVASPGATTTVTIYLPSPAPAGYTWYKYTAAGGWTNYSGYALFNANRDQVTLTLTDGGAGDDDGVVNGVIIDPSGVGAAPLNSSPSVSTVAGDWGGGGCFIATAGSGTAMESLAGMSKNPFPPTPSAGKHVVCAPYARSAVALLGFLISSAVGVFLLRKIRP